MTADQINEARIWIEDSFADAPADLTDSEVQAAITRHYAGGIAGFLADN